jgi:hypothetical protein
MLFDCFLLSETILHCTWENWQTLTHSGSEQGIEGSERPCNFERDALTNTSSLIVGPQDDI